jgi:hypothetical protein
MHIVVIDMELLDVKAPFFRALPSGAHRYECKALKTSVHERKWQGPVTGR